MPRFEFVNRCGIMAWNWPDTFGNRAADVAALQARIELDWCALKLVDGGAQYNLSAARPVQCGAIRQAGYQAAGGWGYYYLDDVDAEITATLIAIAAFRPAFWLFNVEDRVILDIDEHPARQARLYEAIICAFPRLPLGLVTHAQPRYHPEIDYSAALDHNVEIMPMAYHTAMLTAPQAAVGASLGQLADIGVPSAWVVPGEGLYDSPAMQCSAADVAAWGAAVVGWGCLGYWYWSLDSLLLRPDLEQGIIDSPAPLGWRANG